MHIFGQYSLNSEISTMQHSCTGRVQWYTIKCIGLLTHISNSSMQSHQHKDQNEPIFIRIQSETRIMV